RRRLRAVATLGLPALGPAPHCRRQRARMRRSPPLPPAMPVPVVRQANAGRATGIVLLACGHAGRRTNPNLRACRRSTLACLAALGRRRSLPCGPVGTWTVRALGSRTDERPAAHRAAG